jgi:hypothetical protein
MEGNASHSNQSNNASESSTHPINLRGGKAVQVIVIIGVLFVLLIIVLVVVFTGLASKCPACKKWWSMKELERRELGRQPGVKTVTRKEVRKDAQGNVVGQVERQEQVRVMRITFEGSFRCKGCGHENRRTWEEERENW